MKLPKAGGPFVACCNSGSHGCGNIDCLMERCLERLPLRCLGRGGGTGVPNKISSTGPPAGFVIKLKDEPTIIAPSRW
jgi:hypothetical protein